MSELAEVAALSDLDDSPVVTLKAAEYSRLAGKAVEFFVRRIVSRPAAEWTEKERAFLRGITPILKARRTFLDSVIIDLQMELHDMLVNEPEVQP